MTEADFSAALEKARQIKMTGDEKEQQRRSFAYGNANIENASVTREVVNHAADELKREEHES